MYDANKTSSALYHHLWTSSMQWTFWAQHLEFPTQSVSVGLGMSNHHYLQQNLLRKKENEKVSSYIYLFLFLRKHHWVRHRDTLMVGGRFRSAFRVIGLAHSKWNLESQSKSCLLVGTNPVCPLKLFLPAHSSRVLCASFYSTKNAGHKHMLANEVDALKAETNFGNRIKRTSCQDMPSTRNCSFVIYFPSHDFHVVDCGVHILCSKFNCLLVKMYKEEKKNHLLKCTLPIKMLFC